MNLKLKAISGQTQGAFKQEPYQIISNAVNHSHSPAYPLLKSINSLDDMQL